MSGVVTARCAPNRTFATLASSSKSKVNVQVITSWWVPSSHTGSPSVTLVTTPSDGSAQNGHDDSSYPLKGASGVESQYSVRKSMP